MADSTTGGVPHQVPYPHFGVDNRHRGHFGEQFVRMLAVAANLAGQGYDVPRFLFARLLVRVRMVPLGADGAGVPSGGDRPPACGGAGGGGEGSQSVAGAWTEAVLRGVVTRLSGQGDREAAVYGSLLYEEDTRVRSVRLVCVRRTWTRRLGPGVGVWKWR